MLGAAAGLLVVACGLGGQTVGASPFAQPPPAPAPVYGVTREDAVTADNPPQAFTHPSASCPAASPCYLPDPNPPPLEGLPVDSHTADVYERPTEPGPAATTVHAALDIASSQVGADADYLYFRINLFALDPGTRSLPFVYGFELDYDDDPAGDLLVRVADPGANLGTRFGVAGVAAFWNQNNNLFGERAGLPDGPGGNADGYEILAFDQGANHLNRAPGGNDAVLARIAPDGPALELAVRLPFFDAVKLNPAGVDVSGGVNKAGLRPNASREPIDPASFTLHDRFGRGESGSPFPFLRLAPPSAACPASDRGLAQADREVFDSGTGIDTGIPNPCYPIRALAPFDSAYFTMGTTDPTPTPGPPPRQDEAETGARRGRRASWPVLLAAPVAVVVVAAALIFARRHAGSAGRG